MTTTTTWTLEPPTIAAVYPTFVIIKWDEPQPPQGGKAGSNNDLRWAYEVQWRENTDPSQIPHSHEPTPLQHAVIPRTAFGAQSPPLTLREQSVAVEMTVQVTCVGTRRVTTVAADASAVVNGSSKAAPEIIVWHRVINFALDEDAQVVSFKLWDLPDHKNKNQQKEDPSTSMSLGKLPILGAYALSTAGHVDRLPAAMASLLAVNQLPSSPPFATHPCLLGQGYIAGTPFAVVRVQYPHNAATSPPIPHSSLEHYRTFYYLVCLDGIGESVAVPSPTTPPATTLAVSKEASPAGRKSRSQSMSKPEFSCVKRFIAKSGLASTVKQLMIHQSSQLARRRAKGGGEEARYFAYPGSLIQETGGIFTMRMLVTLLQKDPYAAVVVCGYRHVCGHMANVCAGNLLSTIENHHASEKNALCTRVFAINFDGPLAELLTPVVRTETTPSPAPGQAPTTKQVRSYIMQHSAATYSGQFLSVPLSLIRDEDVHAVYGSHGDYGTYLAVQHHQRGLLQQNTSAGVCSNFAISHFSGTAIVSGQSSSSSGSGGGSGGSGKGPTIPSELLPSMERFTDVHLLADASLDPTRSYIATSAGEAAHHFATYNVVNLFGAKSKHDSGLGRRLLGEDDRTAPASYSDESCRIPSVSAVASALNALVSAATISSSVLSGSQGKHSTLPSSVVAAYSEGLMQYYHKEIIRAGGTETDSTKPFATEGGSTSPRRSDGASRSAIPGPHLLGPSAASITSSGLSLLAPPGSLRHLIPSWSTLANLCFGIAGTTTLGTTHASDAQVNNPLVNMPYSGSTATIMGQVCPYFLPTTHRSGSAFAALGFCNPHVVVPRHRTLPPSIPGDMAASTPAPTNTASTAYLVNPSSATRVGYGNAGGTALDSTSAASNCATAFNFGRATSAPLGFRVSLELGGGGDVAVGRIQAAYFGEAQPLALPTIGRNGIPAVEAYAYGLPSTIPALGLSASVSANYHTQFMPALASFCTRVSLQDISDSVLYPTITESAARLVCTTMSDMALLSLTPSSVSDESGTLLEVSVRGTGLMGCEATVQCTSPIELPPQSLRLLPRSLSTVAESVAGNRGGGLEEVLVGTLRLEDHLIPMPTLASLRFSLLLSTSFGIAACEVSVAVPREVSIPMTEWCVAQGNAAQAHTSSSTLAAASHRTWAIGGSVKTVLNNAVLIDPSFWTIADNNAAAASARKGASWVGGAAPSPTTAQPTPGMSGRLLFSIELASDILFDLQSKRSSIFSKISNAASKLTGRRQLTLPPVVGDFCPFNWEAYAHSLKGFQGGSNASLFNAIPSNVANVHLRTLSDHIRARKDVKSLGQQTQQWRTKIETTFGAWMEPLQYASKLRNFYCVLVAQYFYTRAFLAARDVEGVLPAANSPHNPSAPSTPTSPQSKAIQAGTHDTHHPPPHKNDNWMYVAPCGALGVGNGPQSSASLGGFQTAMQSPFDSPSFGVSPGSVALLSIAGEATYHHPRALVLRDPSRWMNHFPAVLLEAIVNAYLVGILQQAGLVAYMADSQPALPSATTTTMPPSSVAGSQPPSYLRHLRCASVGESRAFLEALQQGSGLTIPKTDVRGLPVPVSLSLSFGSFYSILFPIFKESPLCADMTSEDVLADVIAPLWCIPAFVYLRKLALHSQIINIIGAPKTGVTSCKAVLNGLPALAPHRIVKETYRLDETMTASQKGVDCVVICVCEMFDVGTDSVAKHFVAPLQAGVSTVVLAVNKADEFLRKSVIAAVKEVDGTRDGALPIAALLEDVPALVSSTVATLVLTGAVLDDEVLRGVEASTWAACSEGEGSSSQWAALVQSLISSIIVSNLCEGMADRLRSVPAVATSINVTKGPTSSRSALAMVVHGVCTAPRDANLEDAVKGLHEHLNDALTETLNLLANTKIPANHPCLALNKGDASKAAAMPTATSMKAALITWTRTVLGTTIDNSSW